MKKVPAIEIVIATISDSSLPQLLQPDNSTFSFLNVSE
jgi:hypothetical protein